MTISTHKGLFIYTRLCYEVASAPGLFQREMEINLRDINGVLVFFYDICIMGKDRVEHDQRLRQVLDRFKECGLTARKDKCEFFSSSVQFLVCFPC